MMSLEHAVNIVEKNIVGTYATDELGKSQFMCDDDKVAWQTLKDYCTQPTDVQQLKAEIAALIEWYDIPRELAIEQRTVNRAQLLEKLRQLSAV